jgi:hypothetical protein
MQLVKAIEFYIISFKFSYAYGKYLNEYRTNMYAMHVHFY